MIKMLLLQVIPSKLIRLHGMIHENSKAQIVTENNMTESCNVSAGVRQDYSLSVIVLKLILDCIIKKLDIRGSMSIKMLQINTYTVAICRNLTALEGTLQALDNTAQEIRLIILQEKTKCMKVSKKTHNKYKHIAVGGISVCRAPYFGASNN